MTSIRTTALFVFLSMLHAPAVDAVVNQQQFEGILGRLQTLYAPDFKLRQQRLRIHGYWEREQPEAAARTDEDRDGHLAVITVTGGLARHPAITTGALALVVCHEIGHFLAGEPAVGRYSTEGQSDYFAAAACMRRLMSTSPTRFMTDQPRAPSIVKQRCASTYGDKTDRNICIHTTMAGYALSSYFAVGKSVAVPDFHTPDTNKAATLSFGAPTIQCRLDTYIAAALCNPEADNATFSHRHWLCSRGGELARAARPLCWYPGD